MKKTLVLLLVFLPIIAIAQTDFEKGMRKAFDLREAGKTWKAANMFERIAAAAPEKWLPPYYVAQINVIHSFGEKDAAKLTAQLDKAHNFLNDAKSISKENPEILVLEAQWYTAWIAYDGQQYGMSYAPKASALYQKALELAPNNPRIILAKAEWDMGAARYFGKSLEPYCDDVRRAIALFATFVPINEFYPTYGLERAKMILEKSCAKNTK